MRASLDIPLRPAEWMSRTVQTVAFLMLVYTYDVALGLICEVGLGVGKWNTVDSPKLQYGQGMIYIGFPPLLASTVLNLEQKHSLEIRREVQLNIVCTNFSLV